MLPDIEFSEIIRNTPLVSIDFIIENGAGETLLGLRKNAPAKGFWFVPGGRIYKNESIETAMKRIFHAETGMPLPNTEISLMGVFNHLYDDNVFERESFGTHYVVLAHHVRAPAETMSDGGKQHEALKWWRRENALTSALVHQYTKAYFKT